MMRRAFVAAVAPRDQLQLYSADTKKELYAISFEGTPDAARQEFKDECDTSFQLRRFGAGQAFRAPNAGMVDFDMDLQGAIQAMKDAKAAFERLDPELRRRYSSWTAISWAIADGTYKAPEAPGGGSPGAAGASPSDSAAGGSPK